MNDNRLLEIFRRLATHGSHLVRAQALSEASSGQDYEVISGGGREARRPPVPQAEVTGWLSRGLIEACPEGYRISAAGLARLRRALSAGQPFQAQHQTREAQIIDFEGSKRPAIVNNAESPLVWLASRKDKSGA